MKIGAPWLALALVLTAGVIALAADGTPAAPASFDDLDRYLERAMEEARIPGLAVGVVVENRVEHLRGFGRADPSGRPVTAQTPFVIGSVTKALTASAVMQLVEAGKIDLDAPVVKYLPWFRTSDRARSDAITIRQLLNQTSGLSTLSGRDKTGVTNLSDDALEAGVRDLRRETLISRPGARFHYANCNYRILGVVAQTVSGVSYETYMQRQLFDPLGMTRSFTDPARAKRAGLATGHRYWFNHPVATDAPFPRGALPSGYVMSTAEDMSRFLLAHLGIGMPFDPESLDVLHAPASRRGYAMGWFVEEWYGERVLVHSGLTPGFRSAVALVPSRGSAFVLLMNASRTTSESVQAALTGGLIRFLLGKSPGKVTMPPAARRPESVLLAITLGLAAGLVWQIRASRRRTRAYRAPFVQASLAVAALAAWTWGTFVALPAAHMGTFGLLVLFAPDVGWLLVADEVLFFAWAAFVVASRLIPLWRRRAKVSIGSA